MTLRKSKKHGSDYFPERNRVTNGCYQLKYFNMEIEITIAGVTRTYRGDSDTLQNKDWNQNMYNFISDILDGQNTKL